MFDTIKELLSQIELGEDSSLEFKELRFKNNKVSDPHRNSMSDELSAMANTNSGVFLLGIDDKTKSVIGIPKDKLDIVEEWIRGICNDLIKPVLNCRIRKILLPSIDGEIKSIIRIDIERSLFVHKSASGYYNRIGSSKREMTPEILARLFQQRSQSRLIRFDEQAVPDASIELLDKAYWSKFKTNLSPKDEQEFLSKMNLITKNGNGDLCPSVSGILIASEHPEEYLPNAFIQAVCYRGTERNANYQVDAKDITGPLEDQISEALKFVFKNMRISAVKKPHRIETPQFAMNSVFEAIVNAVAHRDYSIQSSKIRLHIFSDRLELFSPGTIPNTMTIESLPIRQASRNELLTSLLSRCPVTTVIHNFSREFLMDKRGEGVPIILTESEKLSGKRPKYRLIDDSELLLTIYSA